MHVSVFQTSRELLLAIEANCVIMSLESKLRISSIFSSKNLGSSLMMLSIRRQDENSVDSDECVSEEEHDDQLKSSLRSEVSFNR